MDIDRFLQNLVDQGQTPGIQFARMDSNGETTALSAGWADLDQKRPMSNGTPMMAYSMSKPITASALVLLEELGELHLDDPLRRYSPHVPYRPDVTLRHLLEHRSGIPNPIPLRWVHLASQHSEFDEEAELNTVVRSNPELEFAPGIKVLYSNLGYWLLGRVVEVVSGKRFTRFVQEDVLRPMGITADEVSYAFPAFRTQANGYLERYSLLNFLRPFLMDRNLSGGYEGSWLRIEDHYVNGPAFGGAIGTALGFCKLALQLHRSAHIGLGWTTSRSSLYKEGGGAGFRCGMRVDLCKSTASVLMTNATGFKVLAALDAAENLKWGECRTPALPPEHRPHAFLPTTISRTLPRPGFPRVQ